MLLRITRHDVAMLTLEGRVTQPYIELLERECAALFAVSSHPILDLSGVTFVDRAGIEGLKRLDQRGAVLRSCPDPVASVLEAEAVAVHRGGRDTGT